MPRSSLLAALLAVIATPAFALSPGQKVENFKLKDQAGQEHKLYDSAGEKAVVLMIQGNGCPIVRQAVPAYREIRDQYQSKGVEFLLLNSNLQDKD